MGRVLMSWGVTEEGRRKGHWTPEEDKLLNEYVNLHREGRWSSLAMSAGLNRNGKSCRLRWVNYLRPGLKRGQLTPQEEGIVIELHALWGNKWSTIARYLPGRTDNEIKNYWRTHFKKKGRTQGKRKPQNLRQKQQQKRQQQSALEANMKRALTSNIAETSNIIEKMNSEAEGKKEMGFMQPTSAMEDQILPAVTYQDVNASWSVGADQGEDQEELWDGLWNWNIDDSFHTASHCNNKMPMQAPAAFTCGGGDSNNMYN